MTDTTAKIRETLVAYKISAMRAGDAQAQAMATEALALLSAEERPSVPTAMHDEAEASGELADRVLRFLGYADGQPDNKEARAWILARIAEHDAKILASRPSREEEMRAALREFTDLYESDLTLVSFPDSTQVELKSTTLGLIRKAAALMDMPLPAPPNVKETP